MFEQYTGSESLPTPPSQERNSTIERLHNLLAEIEAQNQPIHPWERRVSAKESAYRKLKRYQLYR